MRVIRNVLLKASRFALLFGIDAKAAYKTVRYTPSYLRDLRAFRRLVAEAESDFSFGLPYPCFGDARANSGTARGHYFHQDLLVARRIFERKPERHIDVGSRIDGFVAHVASFRSIEVLDVRPLPFNVPNVRFQQADLLALPNAFSCSTDSVSCLHALEHIGLGRYGDRIDPDGHLRGIESLGRMLRDGGILYLSVPIGHARIEFNAHRVFSLDYILDCVRSRFDLLTFSYVDDAGELHEAFDLAGIDTSNSLGCDYGCGIFELRKRT